MTAIRIQYVIAKAPDGRSYAIRRQFYRWGGRSTLVPGALVWDADGVAEAVARDLRRHRPFWLMAHR